MEGVQCDSLSHPRIWRLLPRSCPCSDQIQSPCSDDIGWEIRKLSVLSISFFMEHIKYHTILFYLMKYSTHSIKMSTHQNMLILSHHWGHTAFWSHFFSRDIYVFFFERMTKLELPIQFFHHLQWFKIICFLKFQMHTDIKRFRILEFFG